MASNLFESLQEIATNRRRTLIAVILPDERLADEHAEKIERLLRAQSKQPLDIVLHSNGGSAHAAYQIADILLRKSDDLNIIIPCRAKSAATLIAIVGRQIILGPLAQLGPLDTQIEERTKSGPRTSSALDPFKALEQLTRVALEATDVMIPTLASHGRISLEDAIRHGIDFGTKMSSPLFDQVAPMQVGNYSRALEIGVAYAQRLLKRSGNLPEDTDIDAVVHRLVYGYPSHNYIIDVPELISLGLPAVYAEDSVYGSIDGLADFTSEYCAKAPQTIVDIFTSQAQLPLTSEIPQPSEHVE